MINFLKNLFSTEIEDVLFAYRVGSPIGIVDGRGLKKYSEKDRAKEIYIFSEGKVNDRVCDYLNKLDNLTIIECENCRKEMKNWMKKDKFKNLKIKKVSLDNFGERVTSRDPA
ncbi:MAG: hypothetical protein ACQEQF_06090 [Bacillota bacterium]